MDIGLDIEYSQCIKTPLDFEEDCQPLPCWGRGRRLIPLQELPLFKFLKKATQENPGFLGRHAAPGVGRGRPTNGVSHSMPDDLSDRIDVVGAYWRQQRPLRAPTFNTASDFLDCEEPSALLEEPGNPEPAILPMPRRGIVGSWKNRIAQMVQPDREQSFQAAHSSRRERERFAHSPNPPLRPPPPPKRGPMREQGIPAAHSSRRERERFAHSPNPTHRPPPPPRAALFIRPPAASTGESSQRAQQMHAALATSTKRGSFNASSFNHAHDLGSWVASLSQPRPHDFDDDELTDDDDDMGRQRVPIVEDLADDFVSTSSSDSAVKLTDDEAGGSAGEAVTITELTESSGSLDSVYVCIRADEVRGQGNHPGSPEELD
ncbi:uncharacterized protein LOC144101170 isoform X2 [Amblyomma americanum]